MAAELISDFEIGLFNDSLERCTARPELLDRFYEKFLASSEEIAEKFRHTDFNTQKKVLKVSFYLMMLAAMGRPEADTHLQRIAEVHSRAHRNVRPELYDVWLECLVSTVREFDPFCDADVERAWRVMMRPGIAYMQSRY